MKDDEIRKLNEAMYQEAVRRISKVAEKNDASEELISMLFRIKNLTVPIFRFDLTDSEAAAWITGLILQEQKGGCGPFDWGMIFDFVLSQMNKSQLDSLLHDKSRTGLH